MHEMRTWHAWVFKSMEVFLPWHFFQGSCVEVDAACPWRQMILLYSF